MGTVNYELFCFVVRHHSRVSRGVTPAGVEASRVAKETRHAFEELLV